MRRAHAALAAGRRALRDTFAPAARRALRGWLSRAAAPLFRPDVAVAPDPLAPDPRVVARGVAAAFALCASEGRPVRLLAARAPGAVFRIFLHTVRSECAVERTVPPAPGGRPARAAAALPPFTAGAGPAVFVLGDEAGGDDLRLRLSPGTPRDPRVRVSSGFPA